MAEVPSHLWTGTARSRRGEAPRRPAEGEICAKPVSEAFAADPCAIDTAPRTSCLPTGGIVGAEEHLCTMSSVEEFAVHSSRRAALPCDEQQRKDSATVVHGRARFILSVCSGAVSAQQDEDRSTVPPPSEAPAVFAEWNVRHSGGQLQQSEARGCAKDRL
jgi:hypothetical protein